MFENVNNSHLEENEHALNRPKRKKKLNECNNMIYNVFSKFSWFFVPVAPLHPSVCDAQPWPDSDANTHDKTFV